MHSLKSTTVDYSVLIVVVSAVIVPGKGLLRRYLKSTTVVDPIQRDVGIPIARLEHCIPSRIFKREKS